jgi:hypothetical protein
MHARVARPRLYDYDYQQCMELWVYLAFEDINEGQREAR